MKGPEDFHKGDADSDASAFQDLLETLQCITGILDGAGCIVSVSSAARLTWGHDPGDLSGTDLSVMIHSEDRPAWRDLLGLALAHPDSVTEPRLLRMLRNGGAGPVMLTALRACPGRPERIAFAMTPRETGAPAGAGQTADPEMGLFRPLAEHSAAGMYIIQDGVFQYVNPGYAKMMGYSVDEMTGMNWERASHPDDVPMVRENIRKRASGEMDTIHYEFRNITKTGKTLHVEIYGSGAFFRGKRAVIGTILDISERKRVEEALRKQEELYRLLADNSKDMIWFVDLRGNYAYISPAVLKLRGYTQEEALHQTMEERFTPESAALAGVRMARFFESGQGKESPYMFKDLELQYLCKDGSTVWAEVSAAAVFDESGAFLGVQGASRDITERKKAEEELARRAEALARSNAELEQFAYIASHDLQEPLRMVASFTELLSRRYTGKLDSDADEFIAFAVSGANRMKQLINDLLAYSRVGTKAKPFVTVDCRVVFDHAVRNLAVAIGEGGATVEAGPLPVVMADEVQMTQLFQNLIANAIKFHGSSSPHMEISAGKEGKDWVFSFRDNGIGIDPAHFDRVFAVFQRLHSAKDYPGTGIGLAICKKIVERHKGRIWVESHPGRGSTFRFTIPIEGGKA